MIRSSILVTCNISQSQHTSTKHHGPLEEQAFSAALQANPSNGALAGSLRAQALQVVLCDLDKELGLSFSSTERRVILHGIHSAARGHDRDVQGTAPGQPSLRIAKLNWFIFPMSSTPLPSTGAT